MNMTRKTNHQRKGTRFCDDGRGVLVTLWVDRRNYEYARAWAQFHAAADPEGTAEDHLEGYLGGAVANCRWESRWRAPPEIESLFPEPALPAHSRSR